MDQHTMLQLVAAVLEITGLVLLSLEVLRGQRTEQAERDFPFFKMIQLLYARDDFRGCWILSRIDQGDSPEMARDMASELTDAQIAEAITQQWGPLSAKLASRMKWLDGQSPKVFRWRSRMLRLGTFCLVAAVIVHCLN